MKTINVWLVLVSLLVSFSCRTSSDLDLAVVSNLEDKSSQSEASAYERSGDEIQKIALDVATMLRSSDRLRSSKTLSVASVFTLQDDGELRNSSASDANLQVVEFSDNEGYAIVSANRGDDGVLYIADNGKFDKEFYNKYLEPHIEAYRNQWDSYGCPVCGGIGTCPRKGCIVVNDCPVKCTYLICPHQPKPPVDDDLWEKFRPKYNWSVLRIKENLLKTNWGLGKPLNIFAPMVKYKENGAIKEGRADIGCNTVAIMQIMAYHQFPKLINGEAIPWKRYRTMDDFDGTDSIIIAKAAKYVAEEIKSEYGINYTTNTSASSEDVKEFMLKVGYKNYTRKAYNIDAVMDELDQNRPLFITGYKKSGGGHIWIIDGYQEVQYIQPSDTIVRNFVHCNWGWNKKSNQGYCLSGMFSSERQYDAWDIMDGVINSNPPEKAYNEYCSIYTGIEPKRL